MGDYTHTPLVSVVLFGWIPVVLVIFATLPARRAVIVSFLFAWLFLPVASYSIPYFPDYDKTSATSIGVLCATLIFDAERLFRFRPRWFDLPVLLFSFCPLFSSISNGLGVYDGLSQALGYIVAWMVPYFIGRVYFDTPEAMRDLAIGIFVGGLIYAPLCLFEIRMSPQLHRLVYGYHTMQFAQTMRYGGYRPVVFIGGSGLTLSLWMGFTTLCGYWLWRSRMLVRYMGMPVWMLAAGLFVTTILTKSSLAVVLMMLGIITLEAILFFRNSAPIVIWNVLSVLYILIRVTGLWNGGEAVDISGEVFGPDRAQSLDFRFENEIILCERAWMRPLFGWGGWGRDRVTDEEGKVTTVTDSRWIILFGQNGLAGLATFIATFILPGLLLRWRINPKYWATSPIAALPLAALLVCLSFANMLFNAQFVPIVLVMLGGLPGVRILMQQYAQPRFIPSAATADAPPPVSQRNRILARRKALKEHSQP